MLRSDCLAMVSRFSLDYLWHRDPFSISHLDEGCLRGKVNFGENIEDEWYVVSLLRELTLRDPDLVVRVTDQDGEVLLIEVADELPKWAQEPSTSDGRAYLHKGDLHIIPVAQTPGQLTPFPGAEAVTDHKRGADVVRSLSHVTRAPEQVQCALRARLGGYPGDWSRFKHYAHFKVPPKVKKLLHKNPQLASEAVRAFYERDPIDTRALRTMKNFPPVSLTKIGLTLSKCLFSMLATQKYKPDKRAGWPKSDEKSLDLGIKLTCGFEILAQRDLHRNGAEGSSASDGAFARYVASLKPKGYFQGELEGSTKYQDLLSKARNYFDRSVNPDASRPLLPVDVGDDDNEVSSEPLAEADDESWMNFDDRSFDKLLASHFNVKETGGGGAAQTEGIPEELKRFLNQMSDFQGVETEQHDAERQDNFDGEVSFDVDQLESALTKVLNIRDTDEDASDEDLDQDDLEELEAYDAEMKAELAKTKVFQDDEKVENVQDLDKPLDVDAKVLKNLLESFHSQGDLSGPATTLLKPLGIDINSDM